MFCLLYPCNYSLYHACNNCQTRGGLSGSLRSRRDSRAQGGKLEIPPVQKLSILSSAHRAHGSAHTNVFALENQSERKLLKMILAGLQCSKRCNCFVFFCHGEQSNCHETFAKAYTVNIMLFPNPVGKIALTSFITKQQMLDCSHFKTMHGSPDSRSIIQLFLNTFVNFFISACCHSIKIYLKILKSEDVNKFNITRSRSQCQGATSKISTN